MSGKKGKSGVYKRSDKNLQHMKTYKNTKGKHWKLSDNTKGKMSINKKGKTSPMKGRFHSQKTKEKISFTKNNKDFGKKEKHWNWKGGISINAHSITEPKYKLWRSNIFERDNWTCQTCGIRGVYLEAHHIKSWAKFKELRYILENGVTLCRECHKLTDNYKGKNND